MKIKLNEEIENTQDTLTLANSILVNLNGENDAISGYNSLIGMLQSMGQDKYIRIIEDIISEEMNHIGMLQSMLKDIYPDAQHISAGEDEAAEHLDAEPVNTDVTAVIESVDTDDDYDEDEQLKLLAEFTNDFTDQDGYITCYDERTKNLVKKELQKYYKTIDVSDGRMSADEDMCWVVAYSDK